MVERHPSPYLADSCLCVITEDSREAMFFAGGVSTLFHIMKDLKDQETQDISLLRPVCEMLTWAPEGDTTRILYISEVHSHSIQGLSVVTMRPSKLSCKYWATIYQAKMSCL